MERIVTTTTERQTLGEDKVRVSLTLPTLPEKAQTPLQKSFSKYYGGMRSGFLRFAKESLLKRAANQNVPFGAVLKAVVSYENKSVVSVYVDAAVSTGDARTITRLPQLWDKKSGTLIRAEALFLKRAKSALMPLLEKSSISRAESAAVPLYSDWRVLLNKHFDKKAFYLSPRGLAFIYSAGVLSDKNEVFPVHVAQNDLTAVLKESAYASFWGEE